jgi:ribosomal protein S18 acetylase RimI-like enzyme
MRLTRWDAMKRITVRGESLAIRRLTMDDLAAVNRLFHTSEYTTRRFGADELPHLLATQPAYGVFTIPPGPLGWLTGGTLRACLLLSSVVPPSAWIGGFGVTWSASTQATGLFNDLLAEVESAAAASGASALYYSGNDGNGDWLRPMLEARGFGLVATLRSYDKSDTAIPSWGDQTVTVRPFIERDVEGVLEVERNAFAPMWRYDADGFREVNRGYPYFVVAEDAGEIVGYQFNALDHGLGYLVRIAVHPRAAGRHIGTRLMAEAVRYFTSKRVLRILLNTEDENHHARRLYEWFGFYVVPPAGFALGKRLD